MSRRSTSIQPYLAAVRKMADTLAVLQQKVAALDTVSQADFTSVEDGSIDVYDDDGELRARLGKQADGSFALKAFAPTPETPTEPDVIPVPGGCVVEWDGTFEDAQEEPIQRVAIHVGYTSDFEVNTGIDAENSDEDQTEKAAILSPRGGSAFLALELGETSAWVRLTAVAEGGAESPPSDAVEVTITAPEAAFWQDEFVLRNVGGQTLRLTFEPINNSDHLYWNGLYQREDWSWTRIGKNVTLSGEPYPAKIGDRVTVEYAYVPGDQPEEITFNRGTPVEAWYDGYPSIDESWDDYFYVRFQEPVLTEHYIELGYLTPEADLQNHSMMMMFVEEYLDGTLHEAYRSYTNRGTFYTAWNDELPSSNTGDESDPDTYLCWTRFHTAAVGERHPHNIVGVQLWPYPGGDAGDGEEPPIGLTDGRNGYFWLGPQVPGQNTPWAPFGR